MYMYIYIYIHTLRTVHQHTHTHTRTIYIYIYMHTHVYIQLTMVIESSQFSRMVINLLLGVCIANLFGFPWFKWYDGWSCRKQSNHVLTVTPPGMMKYGYVVLRKPKPQHLQQMHKASGYDILVKDQWRKAINGAWLGYECIPWGLKGASKSFSST